jgi:hypothetical protein
VADASTDLGLTPLTCRPITKNVVFDHVEFSLQTAHMCACELSANFKVAQGVRVRLRQLQADAGGGLEE